jgi:hypothetical protein
MSTAKTMLKKVINMDITKVDPPKIPERIQRRIDEFKKSLSPVLEPEVVYLKSGREFSDSKHRNCIISFPPGGKVGDSEWKLQYMHNTCVLLDVADRKKQAKEPSFAPETYVSLNNSEIIHSVAVYIGDHIWNEIEVEWVMIYNMMFDITPGPLGKDEYFINLCVNPDTPNVKTMIKYRNGHEEPVQVKELLYS